MVIQSRIEAPDWTADGDEEVRARCLNYPIPSPEDDVYFKDAEEALYVCNGFEDQKPCPMRDSCLFAGLINNEWGVWGGMTHPQRKWIRKHIDKKHWRNAQLLRRKVPPPEYFNDWGDEDEDD